MKEWKSAAISVFFGWGGGVVSTKKARVTCFCFFGRTDSTHDKCSLACVESMEDDGRLTGRKGFFSVSPRRRTKPEYRKDAIKSAAVKGSVKNNNNAMLTGRQRISLMVWNAKRMALDTRL